MQGNIIIPDTDSTLTSPVNRVGGVKLSELALLELEFLYRVDWRIIPDNAILVDYYKGLINRTDGYTLAQPSLVRRSASDETNGSEETENSSIGTERWNALEAELNHVAVDTTSIDSTGHTNKENLPAGGTTTASEKSEKSIPAGL